MSTSRGRGRPPRLRLPRNAAAAARRYAFLGWEPKTRDAALALLRTGAAAAGGGAHVYVHGFNNTPQFAARTAALLAAAHGRAAACFAWPSNPPLPRSWAIAAVLSVAERNYTAAEQQMQRSVSSLAACAARLREGLPASTKLQWTAHSMGCYLVLLATRERVDASTFHRVVLLAPDVPTWFFVDAVKRAVPFAERRSARDPD